ncbi:MAG: hypothetical protein U0992_11260 [Planctomycetaceae bacterium]
MLAWAFRHPDCRVDKLGNIYPATDFRSWPKLPQVITYPEPGLGYNLTLDELTRIAEFNPIDNLAAGEGQGPDPAHPRRQGRCRPDAGELDGVRQTLRCSAARRGSSSSPASDTAEKRSTNPTPSPNSCWQTDVAAPQPLPQAAGMLIARAPFRIYPRTG